MEKEVTLKSKHFKNIDDNAPMAAIKKLAEKAIASNNDGKIKDSLTDILSYLESIGHGNVFTLIPKVNMRESSCIEYINEQGLAHYANNLIGFITYSLITIDKSTIYAMEGHFEHIHSFWMVKAFKYDDDVQGSELLLVYLTNAIGMLRGFYNMERSPVILHCKEQKENKCFVWNCPNRGDILIYTPLGIWRFCKKCNERIISKLQNIRMCGELLRQSNGETVVINNWEEFADRLMPEFLQMMTDCLEIAGHDCCVCGEPAVGTGAGFKPYCKEDVGFPRDVLKCVLRK